MNFTEPPRIAAIINNVAIGLVQAGWTLPEGYLDRVLGFIIDAYETRPVASVSFYPAPYIRFALARLWRSIDDVKHASAEASPNVVPRLRAILDGIEEQVIAAQRWDGGWGTR